MVRTGNSFRINSTLIDMKSKQFLITLGLWLSIFGALAAPKNEEKNNTNNTIEDTEICDTKECRQIAGAFIESMNKSVDPCVNFYEFSCGNWESKRPIPKYEHQWNRFREFESLVENRLHEELEKPSTSDDLLPIQQVKTWYQSCMNENRESRGLESINSILLRIGGWPMVMSTHAWDEDTISWQAIDRYYQKLIGDNTFYSTQASNCGFYDCLEINNQEFPLNDVLPLNPRNFTSDDGIFYRSIIKSVAKLFIDKYNTYVSDEKLEEDINDIIEFEQRIYEASKRTNVSDKIRLYQQEVKYIGRLNNFIEWWNNRTESITTPPQAKIDWGEEFQGLFDIANLPVNMSARIEVESISYLMDLVEILNSTDKRTIVNYIQWNFVSKIFRYVNNDMKNIFHKIIKRQKGTPERPPRWIECIREIKMTDAATYLFVKKHYNNSREQAVAEIIENIKKSVEYQLTNLTWLSFDTKSTIKFKINHIKHSIGHPSWYKNETVFLDYYKGLTVGENYFNNVMSFMRYERALQLRKFTGQVLPRRWPLDALKANAVLEAVILTMMVPAALLQSPLFSINLPDYVNYGIVGNIIGHEISHAFDSNGLYFIGPSFWPILTHDEHQLYVLRVECFMKMFDKNYKGYNNTTQTSYDKSSITAERLSPIYAYLGVKENETKINEYLADSAGIEATLRAYREFRNGETTNMQMKLPGFEEFTDEQMFFISYGQIWCKASKTSLEKANGNEKKFHASENLRVMGTLANSPAFAEAFNCPKESPMNRENKCGVWSE